MDIELFIDKLIAGTKSGKLQWQIANSNRLSDFSEPFFIEKGDKRLVLEECLQTTLISPTKRSLDIYYLLSVCDEAFTKLDEIGGYHNLQMLCRAIRRQVYHIDDIMEDFVSEVV